MAPDAFYCYLPITNDRLYLKGTKMEKQADCCKHIAAINPDQRGFEYGKRLLNMYLKIGIFSTASEFGLRICSNKFETCRSFQAPSVPHPGPQPNRFQSHWSGGGFPVLKFEGQPGAGFLVRTVRQTLRALYTKMDLVLSQKLDSGEPAKGLVIGGMAEDPKLFAYKRYALADDWSNHYQDRQVPPNRWGKGNGNKSARALDEYCRGYHAGTSPKPMLLKWQSGPKRRESYREEHSREMHSLYR